MFGLGMLARLGGANQRALTNRIGRVLQNASEFLVFGAGFLPLMRFVEKLGAFILKLSTGVRKFAVELPVQTRESIAGIFGFVGQGMLVIDCLIIADREYEFASGFIGARAHENKRGIGTRSGIGVESVQTFLRMTSSDGRRHKALENLLLDDRVGIIFQQRGEILIRRGILA